MSLHEAFTRLLEDWPELAGFCGARIRRATLSSLGPDVVQERIAQLGALAAHAAECIDSAVLRAAGDFFSLLFDSRRWCSNPDVLSEGSALLLRQALDARLDASEAERLSGWLASIPSALPEGRIDRDEPDDRALTLARDIADGFVAQVEALRPWVRASALDAALRALQEHRQWLADLRPRAKLGALGPETLDRWLQARHAGWTAAELSAACDAEIARLAEHRAQLEPNVTSGPLEERMARALELASARWASAGLPPCALRFDVHRTPAALEPAIPTAAVFTPRPMRPEEPGLVMLTAGAGLETRSRARLLNLAVHEGGPGHGLQAQRANAAGRPWRAVDLSPIPGFGAGLFAGEVMEGWAHFAEARFSEVADDLELQDVVRAEALWRAVRARADLGFARGELDAQQAAHLLVQRAGLTPEAALAEVDDFRLNPTYGLSYFAGKRRVQELRARHAGHEAELYAELLDEGLVPLGLRKT